MKLTLKHSKLPFKSLVIELSTVSELLDGSLKLAVHVILLEFSSLLFFLSLDYVCTESLKALLDVLKTAFSIPVSNDIVFVASGISF